MHGRWRRGQAGEMSHFASAVEVPAGVEDDRLVIKSMPVHRKLKALKVMALPDAFRRRGSPHA
jgi:hypothetical protein